MGAAQSNTVMNGVAWGFIVLISVVICLALGALLYEDSVSPRQRYCASVANVNRGPAWVRWHESNLLWDTRHGLVAWERREALDVTCRI